MTTALADETTNTAVATRPMDRTSGRLFEPSGSTLEDTILHAWEDLRLGGRTECPVCAGELEAAGCSTCGSELS